MGKVLERTKGYCLIQKYSQRASIIQLRSPNPTIAISIPTPSQNSFSLKPPQSKASTSKPDTSSLFRNPLPGTASRDQSFRAFFPRSRPCLSLTTTLPIRRMIRACAAHMWLMNSRQGYLRAGSGTASSSLNTCAPQPRRERTRVTRLKEACV